MNFKYLALMNDAFLSKQFCPSTLVSRIFRAKYFCNTSLLSSTLHPDASSVWKSIWKAGMQLKDLFEHNGDLAPKWLGDSIGLFTVKSTYLVLKQQSDIKLLNQIRESSNKSTVTAFWKKYGD